MLVREPSSKLINTEAKKVRNIAVIPARSGSKRIVKKNIKPFLGKPLLAYSIEAAKRTGLFERIIVSTDCQEIADVAIKYGAEVPFLRPASLADDFSPIADVIEHTIVAVECVGREIDFACCIYATAPLLDTYDLVSAYHDLKESTNFKTALAVTEFSFPIQRALHNDDSRGLKMIEPKNQFVRSQDLEKSYHDAGQFFWVRRDESLVDPEMGYLPVLIDRRRVQDIDTPEDWNFAECMARAFAEMNREEMECVDV